MMRTIRGLIICTFVLLLTSSPAWAQATAELNGRVTDESGAVLPGVTVTATQTDTGFTRTVVTDDDRQLRDAEPADRSVPAGGRRCRDSGPTCRPASCCRSARRRRSMPRSASAISRRRCRSKRRRRSWTCAAPASARWSNRSASSSCRCRDARSPT